MLETWLNLIGLLLTGGGAFVAARAVIISDEQAQLLSGTYWNGNNTLRDALLAQSRSARNGLLCVVFGTALQVAAVALPILPGQAHTQETAIMAYGSCSIDEAKNSKVAGFLHNCMASKGFLYDWKAKECIDAAAQTIYPARCFRGEERPGLIDRIRRALGGQRE